MVIVSGWTALDWRRSRSCSQVRSSFLASCFSFSFHRHCPRNRTLSFPFAPSPPPSEQRAEFESHLHIEFEQLIALLRKRFEEMSWFDSLNRMLVFEMSREVFQ